MTTAITNTPEFKAARRALNALRRKHSNDFMEWALFYEAENSICPDIQFSPQTVYDSTCNELDDRLLTMVAGSFGFSPRQFDKALLDADWDEQGRQVAAALATTGVCPYMLRGEFCRNAPINHPEKCGCRKEAK